jgi:hypothetical protein
MDAPKKRGRGRPKKIQDEEVTTEVTTELLQFEDIKHVIRTLNWSGGYEEGSQPAEVIEDHLKQSYFSQGYKLYSVEHLQTVQRAEGGPFGSIMLYILVK